jgi:hypothetical protein
LDPIYKYYFGDGGDVQNPNLIAMLLRRVERIVVFCNFVTPIRSDFDPNSTKVTDYTHEHTQKMALPLLAIPCSVIYTHEHTQKMAPPLLACWPFHAVILHNVILRSTNILHSTNIFRTYTCR